MIQVELAFAMGISLRSKVALESVLKTKLNCFICKLGCARIFAVQGELCEYGCARCETAT